MASINQELLDVWNQPVLQLTPDNFPGLQPSAPSEEGGGEGSSSTVTPSSFPSYVTPSDIPITPFDSLPVAPASNPVAPRPAAPVTPITPVLPSKPAQQTNWMLWLGIAGVVGVGGYLAYRALRKKR
jgi:hypothetical protein